jgi:hypothetical protein
MLKTFSNAANKLGHTVSSLVAYYVVSYYRFLNTDPEVPGHSIWDLALSSVTKTAFFLILCNVIYTVA